VSMWVINTLVVRVPRRGTRERVDSIGTTVQVTTTCANIITMTERMIYVELTKLRVLLRYLYKLVHKMCPFITILVDTCTCTWDLYSLDYCRKY
jgi:hypothetical protein